MNTVDKVEHNPILQLPEGPRLQRSPYVATTGGAGGIQGGQVPIRRGSTSETPSSFLGRVEGRDSEADGGLTGELGSVYKAAVIGSVQAISDTPVG
jgi:hypothetical protein